MTTVALQTANEVKHHVTETQRVVLSSVTPLLSGNGEVRIDLVFAV